MCDLLGNDVAASSVFIGTVLGSALGISSGSWGFLGAPGAKR